MERIKEFIISPTERILDFMERKGTSLIKSGITLYDLLKRPEIKYDDLQKIGLDNKELSRQEREQVEIQVKYEGYIKKQIRQAEQFKKMENRIIPENIVYEDIRGLRIEARQQLNEIKPRSIGQASRISGVSPADISVLLVYLEKMRRQRILEE